MQHASARSRESAPPSLTLVVAATPGISNAIVNRALNETTAIWRAAGVTLEWRLSNGSSRTSNPSTVEVVLDDARGSVSGGDLPIGWINFNPSGMPDGIVHLSYRNVLRLIDAADAYRSRPTSYKELLVARALGRALAHELGHQLTASKSHSPSGLMKGRRLIDELFSAARSGFLLDGDEQRLAIHGLTSIAEHCDASTESPVEQPACCGAQPRREPSQGEAVLLRKHEGGFRQVHFPGDRLHPVVAAPVDQEADGRRIAAERRGCECVDLHEWDGVAC
jgi:hypothetical protein